MYKLITFVGEYRYESEAETYDEIISLAMDAFNNNHELYEVQKDGKIILFHGDIYKLIGKAVY